MKIVYACTITDNETIDIVLKNINHLKKLQIELITIVNTNHKIDNIEQIFQVSDMKNSRVSLHKKALEYKADAYFIFDSDIDITNLDINDFNKIKEYKNNYDFISLYYKQDPPIPAFYTLSSSLNDYYNHLMNLKGITSSFFDDSDFNASTYQTSNRNIPNKEIKDILKGKSYSRDIIEFINIVNEKDTTTGGVTIYFNNKVLKEEFKWYSYKNKSLTWYDSYRTLLLSKKYKFAKVPIFVKHHRHKDSIQLNWDSVIRYILGFNILMKTKDKQWNKESLILHTIELFYFIKGMIIKIESVKEYDKETIKHIKEFMNINIFEIIERIKKWK